MNALGAQRDSKIRKDISFWFRELRLIDARVGIDCGCGIQDVPWRISVTLLVYVGIEIFDKKTSLQFVAGTRCTKATRNVGTC